MHDVFLSGHTPDDDARRPRIRFQSDWGGANLTRVAGWLAQRLWNTLPGHPLSTIETGRGMGDNLRALAAGDVDIAIATPSLYARLAREGVGPFVGAAMPHLRGLATLPHSDAMLVACRRDLGWTSLRDAAAHSGPLRFSLGTDDRDGFMGFAGNALLAAAGLSEAEIVTRDGLIRRHEQPFGAIDDLREGRADVLIEEAIMTPSWLRLTEEAEVSILALSPTEEKYLADTWGLQARTLPAHRLPPIDKPTRVLDYSGWIVATTDRLPDDVAAGVAQAIIEDAGSLERHYRHMPPTASPLTYPIDPGEASVTPIPLHPAAEHVYRTLLSDT